MATMNPSFTTERRHIPDRRSAAMTQTAAGPTHMAAAEWIPMILLAIGGINWGLIGLFDFNLVERIFGDGSLLTRIIYVAVGISALYSLYMSGRMSRHRH